MESNELILSVSDFVGFLNQTLEYAYPTVTIVGEVANFRVSKNRWVYFDLKDEFSSVKFFGTVYQMSGPLEDGLMLKVTGMPRLHQLYGFSVNVTSVQPVGEGSLKRASDLLAAKLVKEGLFDESRKRLLPYPPKRIGLITSGESAAYADFVKILNARWGGVEILLADVQVQGVASPAQVVAAIEHFNTHAEPVDVLVVTRGGGSPDDLAAFSSEQVTRAVAGSRIPTLVAIGHEIDSSLAELAADRRASTPSNAAEMLVPDKAYELKKVIDARGSLLDLVQDRLRDSKRRVQEQQVLLGELASSVVVKAKERLASRIQLLEVLNPAAALKRGYAVIRSEQGIVRSGTNVLVGQQLDIVIADATIETTVEKVTLQ